MQESKDRFIEIAAGGKKLNGDVKRLDEIKPLEYEIKEFEKSNILFDYPKEKTEEELYSDYLTELDRLRKHYAPFLRECSPKIKKNEKVLKSFLYKKEEESDLKNFASVMNIANDKGFVAVTLPFYTGPDGRWSAYFKRLLNIKKYDPTNFEYILQFDSVDYYCEVYINGRCVITHTGFFDKFDCDITKHCHEGDNSLFIIVKNDYTSTGVSVDGMTCYGDKLYGATHLGYDEPNLGWHHCPSGLGIAGGVKLITSSKVRITDIFVDTDIHTGEIFVKTTLFNYYDRPANASVMYSINGRNFREVVVEDERGTCNRLQPDTNYLEHKFVLNNFRLWTQDKPYLYDVTVYIQDENGNTIDMCKKHFGFRDFRMDLNSKPHKGILYFNDKQIILRGTNEMGHLERCLMEGNTGQLIDDILCAKICNLNYYRMTQRPVFDDIYTYFDMLGMLCQSDFPLFSYMKPSSLGEALKQVDVMEHITRSHPSVIMETFCNETLDKTAWGKEQYVMSRFEMEKFFDAARQVVEISNPKRVIKYCEGDYAPLENTYGISDFHCYTYWYISHGMPSGKLRKGYLPPIRKDYMTGCGEFGVDGLDRYELLKKYCPSDWLPKDINDEWSPKTIKKGQCYSLHGDFFPEENNILSWIKASREFQKKAIKEYVDLLRFRSDYIEQTAVHLLIDAWPCGWTKTLVDVDRIPKPAYYSFKEANTPLRVYLRRDQYTVYENSLVKLDVFGFNDLPKSTSVKVVVNVKYSDKILSYELASRCKHSTTSYLGSIYLDTSNYTGEIECTTKMVSNVNVTYDRVTFTVCPKNVPAKSTPVILTDKLKDINLLCDGPVDENFIMVDRDYYLEHQTELEEKAYSGKTIYVHMDKPLNCLGEDIIFRIHTLEEEVRANNLIYPSNNHEYTKEFNLLDFKDFYNKDLDYQDLTSWFKFYWEGSKEILYTFEDTNDEKYKFHKKHKMIMAEKEYGKGKIILSTLSCVNGCLSVNPVLDKLFIDIINKNHSK